MAISCAIRRDVTHRRQALGAAGEDRAARWYRDRRYKILDRNWRCREGELDLVVQAPDGTIVFSEVKTRTTSRFGAPVEAVTVDKQRRIRQLAARYLQSLPGEPSRSARSEQRRPAGRRIRFDVVAVRGETVEVREGVF